MFSFPRPWCPNDPDQLAKEKLLFAPGEKQIYSNLGYCLLGLIVEKITKKPYREFVEETIAISKYNIKFIDGPFLDDEVTYDFLNDGIFNENYYKSLDFNSGSSSAGLSGSASAFAKLVREIIDSKIDILARSSFSGCNEREIKGCYGYAFDHYQRDDESMKVYFHDGYIPGASSLLVIDENGGVLVLLNAGRVRFQKEQNEKFALAYELLQQYRH